jgi:hypothetical protein
MLENIQQNFIARGYLFTILQQIVIIGDGLVFRPLKNTLKDVASGEIATLNNVATQEKSLMSPLKQDISHSSGGSNSIT